MITCWIDGEPVPHARPRVTRNGTYTPAKSKNWMRHVACSLIGETVQPMGGALAVTLTFWLPRPKCHARALYPWHSPDIDNFAKGTLDACKGLLWHDDRQIVDLRVYKRFASGAGCGVEITVEPCAVTQAMKGVE